jgi:hypothetical protein
MSQELNRDCVVDLDGLVVNYFSIDSSGTVLEFSRILLQRNDLKGGLWLYCSLWKRCGGMNIYYDE